MIAKMKRVGSMILALALVAAFAPIGSSPTVAIADETDGTLEAQAALQDVIQLSTGFRQKNVDAAYEFAMKIMRNPGSSPNATISGRTVDITFPADSIDATAAELARVAWRVYESPEMVDLASSYMDIWSGYPQPGEENRGDWRASRMGFMFVKSDGTIPLSDYQTRMQQIDAVADEALTWIDSSMSEAEKAKALYDFVTTSISYGGGATSSSTSGYDGLVNKLTTCSGFAKAYSYLLYRAGIESRLVSGTIGNQAHVWNMVRIDGSWYHCDPTSDQGGTGHSFLISDETARTWAYLYWRSDKFLGGTTPTPATPAQDYQNAALRDHTYTGPTKSFEQVASCAPVLKSFAPGTITAVWGASTGATGYELWRSTNASSGFAKVADSASTNFEDKSLNASTTYYYKVRAYKQEGSSKTYAPESKVVSARANYDISSTIAQFNRFANYSFGYDGSPKTPSLVVTFGRQQLQAGKDFQMTYRDNVNAGVGTIILTGINGAVGSREYDFTIIPLDLNLVEYGYPRPQTYTGKPVEPDISMSLPSFYEVADRDLVKGRDYTVEYSNNVNVGTATMKVIGKGNFTGELEIPFSIKAQLSDTEGNPSGEGNGGADQSSSDVPSIDSQEMFRLYNPNSGEHFYTASDVERDSLTAIGWEYEGVAWKAPKSGPQVYRLYNAVGGEHHYTPNAGERDNLVAAGWVWEEGGWCTDESETVPLYRLYNPNAFANNHHYTTDLDEFLALQGMGWQDEGIAWHGIR